VLCLGNNAMKPAFHQRPQSDTFARGEPADLVRFVWQNAASFSLAHDVSDGGLELAIDEAAMWSRTEPELVMLCHEVSAAGVVVAVGAGTDLPWDDVVELGVV